MYSIAFPEMLSSTKTNLVSDHKATSQNLMLMLKSDRTALFGDPFFGTLLKRMIFDPNSLRVKDLIIDEIYTSIIAFMPQLKIKRSDITLTVDKTDIYINIKCINIIDYKINLYSIKLTEDSTEA